MSKFDDRTIKVVDEKIRALIPLWLDSDKRDDDIGVLLRRINEALPLLQDIKTEVKEAESRKYPPIAPKDKTPEEREEPKVQDDPLTEGIDPVDGTKPGIEPLDTEATNPGLIPAIVDAVENDKPTDMILQMLLGYDPRDKESFQQYLDKQINETLNWFGKFADDAAKGAKTAVWLLSRIAGALANAIKAVSSIQTKRKIKDAYYMTLAIQKDVAIANRGIKNVDKRIDDVIAALTNCCESVQSTLALIESKLDKTGGGGRIPNTGTETPKRGLPWPSTTI